MRFVVVCGLIEGFSQLRLRSAVLLDAVQSGEVAPIHNPAWEMIGCQDGGSSGNYVSEVSLFVQLHNKYTSAACRPPSMISHTWHASSESMIRGCIELKQVVDGNKVPTQVPTVP